MNRISLITASWNNADTIADTLRSVAAQSFPDIEHIIVDGGSVDHTLEVIAEHGRHVARIITEPNKGIAHAYNTGVQAATGDIVGIINADDFYATNSVIQEVVEAFREPNIEAVHAELVYVDRLNTAKIARYWRTPSCTPRNIARGIHPAHPTLFLKRSVYEKAGGFRTDFRIATDTEFMMRIFHVHRVNDRYIPRIWVRMRTGGASGHSARSILHQTREVRRAQMEMGIQSSATAFYGYKIVDRLLQRFRASYVELPPAGFET